MLLAETCTMGTVANQVRAESKNKLWPTKLDTLLAPTNTMLYLSMIGSDSMINIVSQFAYSARL